jgi:hypothetical protein
MAKTASARPATATPIDFTALTPVRPGRAYTPLLRDGKQFSAQGHGIRQLNKTKRA